MRMRFNPLLLKSAEDRYVAEKMLEDIERYRTMNVLDFLEEVSKIRSDYKLIQRAVKLEKIKKLINGRLQDKDADRETP